MARLRAKVNFGEESIEKELKSWDEEVERVEVQLSALEQAITAQVEQDTPDYPRLLTSWQDIEPKLIYQTKDGRLVKFSKRQIKFGQKYDLKDEHLKAIEIGDVAPKGTQGIVPSEKKGFDKKTKVKGQGGDYRFQARYDGNVLYFPGKRTTH